MPKKARFAQFSSVEPGIWELIDFCKREPRIAIQFVRKLWCFYLKNSVPDIVPNGHSEYVKFIIIGRTRSGSNFLRGSLMSHSRIVLFGDLFRSYNAIQWGIPFYPQSKSMLSLIQSDPVRFLETQVFVKFPTCISNVPISLDYEDCLRAFVNTRKWERECDTFFENHHKIDVLYEDLSADYRNEMKRIQEFLGVDYKVVKPLTYEQSRQFLSEAISNYFELKERFKGTPWEAFFED